MCGRYTLRTAPSQWLPLFAPGWEETTLASQLPRYNIAPTQSVAVVLRPEVGSQREVHLLRWGLVPPWADDVSIGSRMINARSETVAEKPSFRHALAARRGLVIADGYYEWKTTPEGKQPYLVERIDRGVFGFAGLWEENRKVNADGGVLRTCTIITTRGNDLTGEVHDRMPVIVPPQHHDVWLDPAYRDIPQLQSLLAPLDNDVLQMTPVSKRVGNVRHDDAECVAAVGERLLWK